MRRSILWSVIGLLCLLTLVWLVTSPLQRSIAFAQLVEACPWQPVQSALCKMRPPLSLIGLVSPVTVAVEDGVILLLDPADFVGRHILLTGAWEPELWQLVEPHLPAGGTFIDVGAHIGYYSLKAAKRVGPHGRIIAIEPNPDTLKSLLANVQASNAAQVEIKPVACFDRSGVLDLFSGSIGNTGASSLAQSNTGTITRFYASRYHVPVRTLDSIVDNLQPTRVDVIKMDIEGSETKALTGARNTIQRFKPVILLEMDDRLLKNLGSSVEQLKDASICLRVLSKAVCWRHLLVDGTGNKDRAGY